MKGSPVIFNLISAALVHIPSSPKPEVGQLFPYESYRLVAERILQFQQHNPSLERQMLLRPPLIYKAWLVLFLALVSSSCKLTNSKAKGGCLSAPASCDNPYFVDEIESMVGFSEHHNYYDEYNEDLSKFYTSTLDDLMKVAETDNPELNAMDTLRNHGHDFYLGNRPTFQTSKLHEWIDSYMNQRLSSRATYRDAPHWRYVTINRSQQYNENYSRFYFSFNPSQIMEQLRVALRSINDMSKNGAKFQFKYLRVGEISRPDVLVVYMPNKRAIEFVNVLKGNNAMALRGEGFRPKFTLKIADNIGFAMQPKSLDASFGMIVTNSVAQGAINCDTTSSTMETKAEAIRKTFEKQGFDPNKPYRRIDF